MTVKDDPSLGNKTTEGYKLLVTRPNQKELARDIGRRLRVARQEIPNGPISQREAGQLAGFGADAQSRVSNYESGRRNVTLADLLALAKVYGKSPVFLTFGVRELPTDEEQLLEDWRNLPDDTQRIIRNILDAELRNGSQEKKRPSRR